MFLKEIIELKKKELETFKPDYSSRVSRFKERISERGPARGFTKAVMNRGGGVRIIAELKKASPSKGVIREDFDLLGIARVYEENGAAALSVLTEERYFLGSLDHIGLVSGSVSLPVLRKDFLIDPYHVYESRAEGADCVLLIVAILGGGLLKEMLAVSRELSMDALVEVHTEGELDEALGAGAGLIGINNRDLTTFTTDIGTTARLAPMVPEGTGVVSESGINTPDDVRRLKPFGVDAFLIGESLVRERDIGAKLGEFLA